MAEPFRIALLIDADNASAKSIDFVLNDLAEYGECNIRRAYGNWTKDGLKPWIAELHDAAIRPMQQFDLTAQKNASDIALAIDAVDLLHSASPDAFAILSSDSDFTPLVHYLREKGRAVYGYGRSKTPAPFKSACTRFTELDKVVPGADAAEPAKAPAKKASAKKTAAKKSDPAPVDVPKAGTATSANDIKGDARLMGVLRSAIASAAEDDGFARVSTVGQRIRNQSSFDPRNYGYSTWTKLFAAIDLFEMRGEGTSEVSVRDPKAH
ncbi:NYN domain-containing protein [Nocardioides sp. Kera G14]|uniref:NYN domain-containing protein n=1 Tax=Nocardioides sp. Kera G14 TaxID=2884264 RepID=UPI001D10E6F6|nr:NYN domain-containing protein [Nocardioides sp. Kera G14]UDY24528.1 NYN domain-containing protein [Nocardioides sp. Kera G14]